MERTLNIDSVKIESGRYPWILFAIKIFYLLILVYCLYSAFVLNQVNNLAALMIITCSLIPSYIWATGKKSGLPVLPLHLIALTWTFAFPIIAGHPQIGRYTGDEIYFAAITVSLYAIVATFAWILISRKQGKKSSSFYTLPPRRGYQFFITCLVVGSLFVYIQIAKIVIFPGAIASIISSTVYSFATLAMFVLAYYTGRHEISRAQRLLFLLAASFYVLIQMTSLFLIGPITSVAIALVGFTIGRHRVPILVFIISFLIFGLFHAGKQEIRERYHFSSGYSFNINQMVTLIYDWAESGFHSISSPEREKSPYSLIYERTSLIHILLLAQRASPESIPFLNGATYKVVPQLLVPRIFVPDKPSSHIGTTMLNVHYGIQRESYTRHTTIGWGLLNESYANFGLLGVIGLAVFTGLLFGFVGRFTVDVPVMSLNNMVGVTFAILALQSEFTMGVFATVMMQSLAVLVFVVPFLVKQKVKN